MAQSVLAAARYTYFAVRSASPFAALRRGRYNTTLYCYKLRFGSYLGAAAHPVANRAPATGSSAREFLLHKDLWREKCGEPISQRRPAWERGVWWSVECIISFHLAMNTETDPPWRLCWKRTVR